MSRSSDIRGKGRKKPEKEVVLSRGVNTTAKTRGNKNREKVKNRKNNMH